MTKQNTAPSAMLPKRLSPELVEVLHMLKSLEAQPAKAQTTTVTR